MVSPLATPEIAFLEPSITAVTDEALYVVDRGNERIVRVTFEYGAIDKKSLFRQRWDPPACLCVSAHRQAGTGLNERFHGGNVTKSVR